jgi:hypothetical protein
VSFERLNLCNQTLVVGQEGKDLHLLLKFWVSGEVLRLISYYTTDAHFYFAQGDWQCPLF